MLLLILFAELHAFNASVLTKENSTSGPSVEEDDVDFLSSDSGCSFKETFSVGDDGTSSLPVRPLTIPSVKLMK